MLKAIACAVVAACGLTAGALAQGNVRVDGYTTKNGTYVAPHVRTAPDGNRSNNYSTQGNVNPNTGQMGTQPAYPSYNNTYGGGSNNLNTYGNQRRN